MTHYDARHEHVSTICIHSIHMHLWCRHLGDTTKFLSSHMQTPGPCAAQCRAVLCLCMQCLRCEIAQWDAHAMRRMPWGARGCSRPTSCKMCAASATRQLLHHAKSLGISGFTPLSRVSKNSSRFLPCKIPTSSKQRPGAEHFLVC